MGLDMENNYKFVDSPNDYDYKKCLRYMYEDYMELVNRYKPKKYGWGNNYVAITKLVNRATPIKPSMSDSGFHICKCTARLKENDNYCWQCGQALDWNIKND